MLSLIAADEYVVLSQVWLRVRDCTYVSRSRREEWSGRPILWLSRKRRRGKKKCFSTTAKTSREFIFYRLGLVLLYRPGTFVWFVSIDLAACGNVNCVQATTVPLYFYENVALIVNTVTSVSIFYKTPNQFSWNLCRIVETLRLVSFCVQRYV